MSLGFIESDVYPSLYYKVVDGDPFILVLYVDGLFLTREERLIVRCNWELGLKFEMKNLGLMHYLLGLEVWQRPGEIFLRQGKYIVKVLSIFDMMDYKSMVTMIVTNVKKLIDFNLYSYFMDPTMYMNLIGSFMYLVNTRKIFSL